MQELIEHYGIEPFHSTTDFLAKICRSYGKLGKVNISIIVGRSPRNEARGKNRDRRLEQRETQILYSPSFNVNCIVLNDDGDLTDGKDCGKRLNARNYVSR